MIELPQVDNRPKRIGNLLMIDKNVLWILCY